jgi:TRAP-type C4-dicarboxylate transport system substrate-binding protein
MTNPMKPVALAAAMAAATLALSTGAASAQAEVTLRCQHFLSPMGSVPRFFIEPWAEKVEADSEGRIDVEIFPSDAAGWRAARALRPDPRRRDRLRLGDPRLHAGPLPRGGGD